MTARPHAPAASRPDDPVSGRDPGHFSNRELSWLEFNARVLHEARRRDTPPLERLRYLGIVSSNLDEFYMVRVAGLRHLARAGVVSRCPAGLTPAEQLAEIGRRVGRLVREQSRCLLGEVLPALAAEGIARVAPRDLDPRAHPAIRRAFEEELFPALTPLAVEDDASFPRVAGLTLHLAVRLRPEGTRGRPGRGGAAAAAERLAVLPLPRAWPRALQIPSERGYRFVLLEELVRHHVERFFPGHDVVEAVAFRVTRDADLEMSHEDVVDLLEAMQGILQARKEGPPVRLEVEARASAPLVRRLCGVFGVDPASELFLVEGPLDLKPLGRLAGQIPAPALRYRAYTPQPVTAFGDDRSIWDVVRERDVLLHLPYDTFEPVVALVNRAADDPQVTAIKQTLYRTSERSPIIAALERAARQGKQVTVLVELKARFDEEQNIDWARRLSDAGAQVVYGVMGLKTHAKLLLVVRREPDGVRRYVHVSTGNYHEETARAYEDVGLFTCDPDLGADASNLFHAVTGYSGPRAWQKLLVAPTSMRERLAELIEREIARSSPEAPGLIQLKLNALVDQKMIRLLYAASRAGVRVRACVRGTCCLRPGIPGLSERIEVVSIVDRFLEHSRILHLRNGGDEELYLSSADWMPRSLDRRIEIAVPVLDPAHRARLLGVLETLFADNQRAWRLLPDGTYERVRPRRGEPRRRAQEELARQAIDRAETSRRARLAVFRPQGPGTAPGVRSAR